MCESQKQFPEFTDFFQSWVWDLINIKFLQKQSQVVSAKYDKINQSLSELKLYREDFGWGLHHKKKKRKRTQQKDFGLCLKDVVTLVNFLYLWKLSVEYMFMQTYFWVLLWDRGCFSAHIWQTGEASATRLYVTEVGVAGIKSWSTRFASHLADNELLACGDVCWTGSILRIDTCWLVTDITDENTR